MSDLNSNKVYKNNLTNGKLVVGNESLLKGFSKLVPLQNIYIIFSKENDSLLMVDKVKIELQKGQAIALSKGQLVEYKYGSNLIVYSFNNDFYCIQHHDQEISCAGILFYNHLALKTLQLNEEDQQHFNLVHNIILRELEKDDNLKDEMLKVLVKQLIINLTRQIKKQQTGNKKENATNELLRKFNILVEQHFKKQHQVSFYAAELFKSPKTLSNSFKTLNVSPLQIIHNRIALEAKRLLSYSNQNFKEIAFELGFKDPSHLSRLFKKQVGISMLSFKKNILLSENSI